MSARGESPDWVRDALAQFAGEVKLFARTALAVTLHPGRFAAEWAAGERRALNPLGFLATAFAVLGPTFAAVTTLIGKQERSSLWLDALGALAPFVYYFLFGALQHGCLRALGSRRRLRESCAMALYAGGGPGLLAQLMVIVLVLVMHFRFGVTDTLELPRAVRLLFTIFALAPFLLFYVTLGVALAGLHRARVWKIAAANFFALAVCAFLFALLDPPGHYGLHLVLGPRFSDGQWHLVVGANL